MKVEAQAWTLAEDQQILRLVETYGPKWKLIGSHLPNRTHYSVRSRYNRLKSWMMAADKGEPSRAQPGHEALHPAVIPPDACTGSDPRLPPWIASGPVTTAASMPTPFEAVANSSFYEVPTAFSMPCYSSTPSPDGDRAPPVAPSATERVPPQLPVGALRGTAEGHAGPPGFLPRPARCSSDDDLVSRSENPFAPRAIPRRGASSSAAPSTDDDDSFVSARAMNAISDVAPLDEQADDQLLCSFESCLSLSDSFARQLDEHLEVDKRPSATMNSSFEAAAARSRSFHANDPDAPLSMFITDRSLDHTDHRAYSRRINDYR
mmetsp:Transcript_28353/g.69011  ORF Transcript_28353/g.69011 Transcript_28353/m.69011 type:complete len:320 (+) Transcript_28353:31-990(+)